MTNFLNKLQWSEQILYPETHQTPSFLESLELPSALQDCTILTGSTQCLTGKQFCKTGFRFYKLPVRSSKFAVVDFFNSGIDKRSGPTRQWYRTLVNEKLKRAGLSLCEDFCSQLLSFRKKDNIDTSTLSCDRL